MERKTASSSVAPALARPEEEQRVLATAVQSVAVATAVVHLGRDAFSVPAHKEIVGALERVLVASPTVMSPDLVEAVLGHAIPLALDAGVDDDRAMALLGILAERAYGSALMDLFRWGAGIVKDPSRGGELSQIWERLRHLPPPPGTGYAGHLDDFDPYKVAAEEERRLWVPSGIEGIDRHFAWTPQRGDKVMRGGISVGTLNMLAAESGGFKSRTLVEFLIRGCINWWRRFGYETSALVAIGEQEAGEVMNAAGAHPQHPRQRHTRGFKELGIRNPLWIMPKSKLSGDIDAVVGFWAEAVQKRIWEGMARGLSEEEAAQTAPRFFALDYPALYLPSGRPRWEALSYAVMRLKEFALRDQSLFDSKRYPALKHWAPIVWTVAQVKGSADLMKRGEFHPPTRYNLTGALDQVDHVDLLVIIRRLAEDMRDPERGLESPARELFLDKVRQGESGVGIRVGYHHGQLIEQPEVINPDTGQPAELGRPYLGYPGLEIA